MSVVRGHKHLMRTQDPCWNCGTNAEKIPYMEWDFYTRAEDGYKVLVLCMRCAAKIKRGFIMDLVQLAAMNELRNYGPWDTYLKRETDLSANVPPGMILFAPKGE